MKNTEPMYCEECNIVIVTHIAVVWYAVSSKAAKTYVSDKTLQQQHNIKRQTGKTTTRHGHKLFIGIILQ